MLSPLVCDIYTHFKKLSREVKVKKLREENVNFWKPTKIEKDAIRSTGRWKYANMLEKRNEEICSSSITSHCWSKNHHVDFSKVA